VQQQFHMGEELCYSWWWWWRWVGLLLQVSLQVCFVVYLRLQFMFGYVDGFGCYCCIWDRYWHCHTANTLLSTLFAEDYT
jgi:hypothetical protein